MKNFKNITTQDGQGKGVKTGDIEDVIKKLRKVLIDMRNVDKRCNTFGRISNDLKNWANSCHFQEN